ncbi:MAG: helix-turn-helix transcriptional regulator [Nitrospinae bacterium]|nr:helix-turn-helix transcriptional regulator [Nitrospinota bacterium]
MKKRNYETITGRLIDLNAISDEEIVFLHSVMKKYKTKPEWSDFSAWWTLELQKHGLPMKSSAWRICQDMEARLGIAQKKVAPPDYPDYLADIIEAKYGSRYKFCKKTGIDQGHLSRVLNGHAGLSVRSLQEILAALNVGIKYQDEDELQLLASPEKAIKALAGV